MKVIYTITQHRVKLKYIVGNLNKQFLYNTILWFLKFRGSLVYEHQGDCGLKLPLHVSSYVEVAGAVSRKSGWKSHGPISESIMGLLHNRYIWMSLHLPPQPLPIQPENSHVMPILRCIFNNASWNDLHIKSRYIAYLLWMMSKTCT